MNRLAWILISLLALLVLFTVFELRHIFFALVVVLVLVGIGICDFMQKKHAILRNFPVIGHARYILEFIRPEIQQYFIATNQSDRPFDREFRSLAYQRAKKIRDTTPFGTQQDIDRPGYESIRHSLSPTVIDTSDKRIMIGGSECTQPYSASRLNISAMSYGALSKNAVRALNGGAKLGNFYHNTGEGGLTPHHLEPGGDLVWQIGTACFGCRTKTGRFDPAQFKDKASHEQVKMIEVKLSQGAKPSHGGILPAAKITEEIAGIRGINRGEDCVSPPHNPEFSTPIELLEYVAKLRELSGGKPVGFKLCIGYRSEFFSICKAMLETEILPDFITIDGAEGGTGAAPLEFSNRLGEPLNDGLIFLNNALTGIDVRNKITVIASGKIITGFSMITKLAFGADVCNSARGMMFALGCIQALQCNANTCPTGVTTQDPRLMRGLVVTDKAVRVKNFHDATLESCLDLAGAMGMNALKDLHLGQIFHRESWAECISYADMYPSLKPAALLQEPIHEVYANSWRKSSAQHF